MSNGRDERNLMRSRYIRNEMGVGVILPGNSSTVHLVSERRNVEAWLGVVIHARPRVFSIYTRRRPRVAAHELFTLLIGLFTVFTLVPAIITR